MREWKKTEDTSRRGKEEKGKGEVAVGQFQAGLGDRGRVSMEWRNGKKTPTLSSKETITLAVD